MISYKQKPRIPHQVLLFVLLLLMAVPLAIAEIPGNWIYETITVGADRQELYSASVRSRNSIQLLSPYEGVNHGLIMIRKLKGGEPEVLVAVDKGQFYTGEKIRVRFDGGNAEWITVGKPGDRREDVLFIAQPLNFIKQIKSAKKLNLAAQFSQNGEKSFDFTLEGLDLAKVGL